MGILNNFISIYCFITFIIGAVFMLVTLCIAAMWKVEEPRNNVHFYVARDKNGELWFYMGKPFRGDTEFHGDLHKQVLALTSYNFKSFGLNENDYANLKWEDEPVEVFISIKS